MVPIRRDDVQDMVDEALLHGKRVPYGFNNPRVVGFAIANPLRRENSGEIYAVGVYLKYKVLEG